MDVLKMAEGDKAELVLGAEEEMAKGNTLQSALLYFLSGNRTKAVEIAAKDGGAYPLMETSRPRLLERFSQAKDRTEITLLARYYFGSEAHIGNFMNNLELA